MAIETKKVSELVTQDAPVSSDEFLMRGSAGLYRINYDKLASAILDKVETKKYNFGSAGEKTLIGAINSIASTILYSTGNYTIGKDGVEGSTDVKISVPATGKYLVFCQIGMNNDCACTGISGYVKINGEKQQWSDDSSKSFAGINSKERAPFGRTLQPICIETLKEGDILTPGLIMTGITNATGNTVWVRLIAICLTVGA